MCPQVKGFQQQQKKAVHHLHLRSFFEAGEEVVQLEMIDAYDVSNSSPSCSSAGG